MKNRIFFFVLYGLLTFLPDLLFSWGIDIPIWIEGNVHVFDADYGIDGSMFVAFQPESGNKILVYDSRNRGYSWSEIYQHDPGRRIEKIKMLVDDNQQQIFLFYVSSSGNLVCVHFDYLEARQGNTAPAHVVKQISSDPIIENSFDVCVHSSRFYTSWFGDVNITAKKIIVHHMTSATFHAPTECYSQPVNWSSGSGTRTSIDACSDKHVTVAYPSHTPKGSSISVIYTDSEGLSWQGPFNFASTSDTRYEPHVAHANTPAITVWIPYNLNRGDHEIDLGLLCSTNGTDYTDHLQSDSTGLDEYISDIENYRIAPNSYVNLLSIEDENGAYRKLYWGFASSGDPGNIRGTRLVNDHDISSWPPEVAPKCIYSPGAFAPGGGAVFTAQNRYGLWFDAPWNVTCGNLLIVTNVSFAPHLGEFIDWKEETGIKTFVVTTDTLEDTEYDLAEAIKREIYDHYQMEFIDYVMLLGDSWIVPTRYTLQGYDSGDVFPDEYLNKAEWGWSWCDGGPYDPKMFTFLPNFFATDLYYADLLDDTGAFATWDSDGDGYFAEIYRNEMNADHIGMIPEVAVARVPAGNPAEVENYLNKVMTYERNTFQADWFNNVQTIANNDWSSWVTQAQKTRDIMSAAGFEASYYEHPDGANADDLINSLTPDGLGFLLYDGHGPGGMGTHEDWQVCGEKFPMVSHGGCDGGIFCPNNLTNNGYLTMDGIFTCGYDGSGPDTCTLMPRDCDGMPPVPDPLQPQIVDGRWAEFLICRHSDRGAITFMGCNTGMQSPGEDHGTWLFEAFTKGYRIAGDMWKYAVQTYIREHYIHAITPHTVREDSLPTPATIWNWVPTAQFHQPMKYTFFGDPSVRIGGVPYMAGKTIVGHKPQIPDVCDVSLTNYPNPFNPETVCRFSLKRECIVTLKVYNIRGQHIADLLNKKLEAGEHQIAWQPEGMPSGLYIIELRIPGFRITKKAMYLR